MPRWPEKELNTQELPGVADKEVVLPTQGSIIETLGELKTIEVVTQPLSNTHADELKFNEEKLTVMIHEDTDPNAEDPVQVAVNGINQFFFRGQPQDAQVRRSPGARQAHTHLHPRDYRWLWLAYQRGTESIQPALSVLGDV